MTILSGEEIDEGGTFRCQKCGSKVRVGKGQTVPKCARCGHDIFDDGSRQDTIH